MDLFRAPALLLLLPVPELRPYKMCRSGDVVLANFVPVFWGKESVALGLKPRWLKSVDVLKYTWLVGRGEGAIGVSKLGSE